MKNVNLALALLAGAAIADTANADLIAHWNFNDSTANSASLQLGVLNSLASNSGSGSLSVSPGSSFNTVSNGTANGAWGTFSGSTVNAVSGDGSGGALVLQGAIGGNSNDPVTTNGSYAQFSVGKASYADLSISFAHRRTNTGFNSLQLSYSTNGGVSFTNLGAAINPGTSSTFAASSFSLAGNATVNAASSIIFRITYNGATGGAGNARVDNLQINGTLIPTPGALALVSLGGLVAARRRRA
jgi:MYXO-CTERM domain-containing protein